MKIPIWREPNKLSVEFREQLENWVNESPNREPIIEIGDDIWEYYITDNGLIGLTDEIGYQKVSIQIDSDFSLDWHLQELYTKLLENIIR